MMRAGHVGASALLPQWALPAYHRSRGWYAELLKRFVRRYAAYHEKRGTPLRVFRIPGRGCRMWLPISWGKTVVQRRFGIYEPWTFSTLARIAKPGMTVVELGACYGEFTIHLSRLVGPAGRVYAFEPFPKYFEIVEKNVLLNGLRNVECLKQAIAPAGVASIAFDDVAINPYGSLDQIAGRDYSRAVRPSAAAAPKTECVECVPLSAFLASRQLVPDLVVMDIEGSEVDVIGDLSSAMPRWPSKPIVFFEIHEAFYRPGELDGMRRALTAAGYRIDQTGRHLLCSPCS